MKTNLNNNNGQLINQVISTDIIISDLPLNSGFGLDQKYNFDIE